MTGLPLAETARRLSGCAHTLRELVHRQAGQINAEPALQRKITLATHLREDAMGASALLQRLAELRSEASAVPAGDADKRLLVAELSDHLSAIDALVDEPTAELLTWLLARQERHLDDLRLGRPEPAPLVLDEQPPRPVPVTPQPPRPARDPFVEEGEAPLPDPSDSPAFTHALLHHELCAAELAARTAHERPEMPWDDQARLARTVGTRIRLVRALDRRLVELGSHWGSEPVDFAFYDRLLALDPRQRVERLLEPGPGPTGQSPLLDHLLADHPLPT